MEKSKIAVLIPAYNESATIYNVVSGALKFGDVIVVDDGSSDGTKEIALQAGAIVLSADTNLGYDGALNYGAKYILDNKYIYFITLDADGQHPICALDDFIEKLSSGHQLVIGNRSKFQRFGEYLFYKVQHRRTQVLDPLCGMKGYSTEILRKRGTFDTYGSVGTELMLYALSNGISAVNINIKTRTRSDFPRFGSIFKSNYKIIRSLIIGLMKF